MNTSTTPIATKQVPTPPGEQRRAVAEVYAERIKERLESPCGCGDGAGPTAETIGYSAAAVKSLPPEAVTGSLGCGDPTSFAGLAAGDVVLDLGSGAGMDLLLASKLVGPSGRVIGVDMTDEMLEHATRNIERAGAHNAEVRKGIIEDLPVEDASVDWVISNCVINLSPEKTRVFAEIARVLKPGGRMLVSDLVAEDLPSEVRELPAVRDACVAGALSEAEYLAGLEAVGLIDVAVVGRLHFDLAQLTAFAESLELMDAPESRDTLRRFAADLEGKVWSAKIHARKPA